MSNDCFEQAGHKTLIFILCVVGYFMLMFGNGIVSLTHPDEVFYVQSAKEMVAHNSWLTPMMFDAPQFEKPIFFFWLLAGWIKLFGVAPFVARFWPAFFAVLGVCVTYGIAWMLFRRKRPAFFSGIILSSSFIYLALARAVLTDMVFSVWVTVSIAFFCWAYQYPARKRTGIVLCLAVSGIAVLTKGILGFSFPAVVIVLFLLYKKDLLFLRDRASLLGLVLFVVIAVPWHVLMYKWHGHTFMEEYFYNVHIRRLLVAEHARLDNWYFYLGLMVAGVFPWSLLGFPAAGLIFSQFRTRQESRHNLVFLLVWIMGIYVFVQPAHSKLASYLFPVFPAIAILIGFYLDHAVRAFEQRGKARGLKICGYIFSGLMCALAAGAVIAGKMYVDVVKNLIPVYVFSGLSCSVAVVTFVFNKKRQYVKMLFSHAGISAALLATLLLARPSIEPWVSCEEICRVFKKIDSSDSTVLTSKFYVRGVRFYTDRNVAVIDINGGGFFSPHPVPFLNTDRKVLDFLSARPVTYAILKEGHVDDLKRITAGQAYLVEDLGGSAGKYILRVSKI
jgi:4-amino-4-deoxy-L-arabinose transferase-like glycosyltransferase